MESIELQAKKNAFKLQQVANGAGTLELFNACLDMVIKMAIALKCNKVRNTGEPGYGISFEITEAENPGQFTFYAKRKGLPKGMVFLAISDDAVGERALELRSKVNDICSRYPGVTVPSDGKHKWPTIGFETVANGEQIVQEVTNFLMNEKLPIRYLADSTADARVLRSIKERRGQDEFRRQLIAVYDGRCVITGCSVEEALEAAHIVPHSADGGYHISNGLLMRSDIHTLFDVHLISICPDTEIVKINPQLMQDYGQFEGKALQGPRNKADAPDRQGLAGHHRIWRSIL